LANNTDNSTKTTKRQNT